MYPLQARLWAGSEACLQARVPGLPARVWSWKTQKYIWFGEDWGLFGGGELTGG